MATRPSNLTYAVDDLPPTGQLVLLGLQQVCLIAIYLVIEVIVIRAAQAPHAVQLLHDGRLVDGPITIRISFDELNFDVELSYSGELLQLPTRRPTTEEDMLEEMPMARGLAGFLIGVYPDHVRYSANNTDCHIRLSFEV